MGKNKLKRFRENLESDIIIQEGKPLFDSIRGRWNEAFFKNNHPITLELACGNGEYTTGLAAIYKERNFIGVDIKGSRIWNGMVATSAQNLENTAFLRAEIYHLDNFFAHGEVNEIWIIFPDPRPKSRDQQLRLTAPRYLELYKRIIKKNGVIHLKTDDTDLFSYTLDALDGFEDVDGLEYTYDLYASGFLAMHHGITTKYEREFLAREEKIKYLRFQF